MTLSGLLSDALTLTDNIPGELILVGSSLGALVATRLSCHDTVKTRVKGVLLIASAAQFIPRYSNIVPDIEGARTFVSKWAGEITLGKCLFDDAKENKWNDSDIAESVNVPVMMVHGDLDDVIPVQSA
mmetsp:Transcript_17668/g.14419  ORF Transcript_17668/g.14419 Transcript_17668/m.14419 type:complete len:128 (-) Transcript_17668:165-548(-)